MTHDTDVCQTTRAPRASAVGLLDRSAHPGLTCSRAGRDIGYMRQSRDLTRKARVPSF